MRNSSDGDHLIAGVSYDCGNVGVKRAILTCFTELEDTVQAKGVGCAFAYL